jgi:hypothetical protein
MSDRRDVQKGIKKCFLMALKYARRTCKALRDVLYYARMAKGISKKFRKEAVQCSGDF